ncbi:hypothetical protein [Streptomyces sp. NPDC004528]|uniref:hypothetical protein n=1 Tax=Streptomyces sp. NPDC004528 TaxID=3154550 RepID=UPI0033A98119
MRVSKVTIFRLLAGLFATLALAIGGAGIASAATPASHTQAVASDFSYGGHGGGGWGGGHGGGGWGGGYGGYGGGGWGGGWGGGGWGGGGWGGGHGGGGWGGGC